MPAICLTAAACFHLQVKAQAVTLELKNASLETAFSQIRAQSGYQFVYTTETLQESNPITLTVKAEPLLQVLSQLFNGQPLSYQVQDRFILIKRNNPASPTKSSHEITGVIVDEKGLAIAGASIMVKRTSKVTVSDADGKFRLEGMEDHDVLLITSVGYHPLEYPIDGQAYLVIHLHIYVSSLDETVIIAYGSTTRRLSTGSISKVSSIEIEKQPVSNPLATLQGHVPGLFITQASGLPGANFYVLLRGQNSIQSGTSPMYIIDGVPFLSNSDHLAQRSLLNANNPFNTIDPGDIASIEVLKDADATAIYGSRGANGVILITTKKGQSGKTSLDLRTSEGWGRTGITVPYLNTAEYLQMRREAFANDGRIPDAGAAPDLLVWDTTRYTDLKKLLIGGVAHQTNATARVSGGNESTNFSLTSGYYRESTVFPGENADTRTSVGLSLSHHSLSGKFTLNLSASYAAEQSTLPVRDLTSSVNLPPDLPLLFDSLGHLRFHEGSSSFGNPFSILWQPYHASTDRLTTQATLSYQLVPNLRIKMDLGMNRINFQETVLTPIASQDPSFAPKGSASFGSSQFKSWIVEPQLVYSTTISQKGKLEALIGGSWQRSSNPSSVISGSGYTNDLLLSSSAAATTVLTTMGDNEYRYAAVFTRLDLKWNDQYVLDLTGRRDGSSRFGPGREFANFGAIGAAWLFYKQKGFQGALPFISYGKLRGSYGLTGNDQISDYQYLDTWTTTQYPYAGQAALRPTRLFNPDYGWEQTLKADVGLDLGFLKDRIYLSLDYYRNQSGNQIINYTLPAQTGFRSVLRNFPGLVENDGWEVELSAMVMKTKNFSWNSSANLTIPRNKLLRFPGLASSSYATSYALGRPLSVLIGYHYLGVDPVTGLYLFEDVNKDGNLNQQDYLVAGTTNPQFYGGWQNSVHLKSWTLDVLFYVTRQMGYNAFVHGFTPPGFSNNIPVALLDHWQSPGDAPSFQKLTETGGLVTTASGRRSSSDGALTNASYIRLKNLSLSYSLSSRWVKKAKITTWDLFLEGENLWTLTPYAAGDPETQNLQVLPPLRMITAGLHITL
ncbi:MAG: SusC/RagA family TonB-linked outer membrane protein [Flavisolibacter sp.]